MIHFNIPLQPITKKNSQQIIQVRGRPIIIPSKAYRQYEKQAKPFIPKLMIDYPINIKSLYYMENLRRVDITNLHSALHDLLVAHGFIADDNSDVVVSTDGSRVLLDRHNPRTEVYVEEVDIPKQLKIGETK